MGSYKRKAIKFIYVLPVAQINYVTLETLCCIYITLNISWKALHILHKDSPDHKQGVYSFPNYFMFLIVYFMNLLGKIFI